GTKQRSLFREVTSVACSCIFPRLVPSWPGRRCLHTLLHESLGAVFQLASYIFAIHVHIDDPLEMLNISKQRRTGAPRNTVVQFRQGEESWRERIGFGQMLVIWNSSKP
uniref:Uncharacterized protein n=1 Tax=Aegilops tauschii subsp. strangulata TaxID=200361 RepID=A0A452Y8U6_AEGTS